MDRKKRLEKKKGSSVGLVILVVFLLFLFGAGATGVWAYHWLQSPASKTNTELQSFTIPQGSSIKSIARSLEEQGLVKHRWSFLLAVKQENLDSRIQAGDFSLRATMSPAQIAQRLTKAEADQVEIKLLEGWRVEEVASALETQLEAEGIAFDPQVFLALPEIREGYVFPDTYYVARTTNEQAIAKTIEANFNQKIASIQPQIEASPNTLDEILIMASIIERESRVDRPLVAGILWERLAIGMPLQVDASLQYIKGYSALEDDWWPDPYAADKELNSPYNTYMYPGLPPAPIANPSLSSIEAAASPESSDYLYYITDNDGNMRYAETYEQHLNNVNRYLR